MVVPVLAGTRFRVLLKGFLPATRWSSKLFGVHGLLTSARLCSELPVHSPIFNHALKIHLLACIISPCLCKSDSSRLPGTGPSPGLSFLICKTKVLDFLFL